MISFIMPAYKARFLAQAIESILSQTDSDWELVVVDDESPEDLGSILASYHDSRIRYYRNEHNLGGENLVRQWNYAITLAKGDWIALAADDDLYAPSFCEECVRLLAKYPDIDLVRTRVLQIDEWGNALWDDGILPEFTNKYEFLYDWLASKAFTCIGNYLFRKEALMSIDGYVIYCGSVSKSLSSAYRVGWFCISQRLLHLRPQMINLNVSVNTPLQLGLADLIHSRAYREHLNRLRLKLMQQVEQYRQYIIQTFTDIDLRLNQPEGGYSLWLQLPEKIKSLDMYYFAQQQNINIVPGIVFGEDEKYNNCIRLNAGHELSTEIQQAIQILAQWVRTKLENGEDN